MRTILRSKDFSCPSCVTKIETSLGRIDGVEQAKVHFATGKIEVHHDSEAVSVKALVDEVRKLGYESSPSPF